VTARPYEHVDLAMVRPFHRYNPAFSM
jgi:hypothetical protein